MKPEVRGLFHELADLSSIEREQIFRDRQIGSELRAEVESLLSFDSTSRQHFTDRVSKAAEELLHSASAREPGYCGQYRLVRLLGSGGMGSVYLAERTDGEIQQQVAVKLLAANRNRPEWRGRFLRERQLLAYLHHPSIVHVIDAGHTEDGQPYLVMEYVEGQPIDEYACGMDLRNRLQLFLRVCEAVSHAHHHLIIHRDLKPSNILVDASGQPKLLDFGIAKLLDETGDATQTVERLLTPNYASPEQLIGAAQTTATDVYSLGAVLYRLLSGGPHYESKAKINPDLPTDLDYILQKVLRDEPGERYASVEAFAADIRAYLESRPVAARSGNAWYRTRKFLRRYWVPVAAAALVIASLLAGLYVANRERAIAQRRFLEVRQLANKLFDIDYQVRQLPGSTKARQLIVDTSVEYLQRLAIDVRGDPELALEVGNAYMRVARVQGVPMSSANLGQTNLAEQSLRTAEALIRSVLVAQPGNRSAFLRMAEIAHDRMMLMGLRRPDNESLVFARQSVEWIERYFRSGKVDLSEGEQVLLVLEHAANQYRSRGQSDEALRLCRKVIDIAPAINQPQHAGIVLQVTTMIHRDRGELDEALRDSQESVRIAELGPGITNHTLGQTMNLALALIREGEILGGDDAISFGRSEEALPPLERAFQIVDEMARQDPNDSNIRIPLSMAGDILAGILRHSGPDRALAIYDQTLLRLAEIKNNSRFRRDEVKALAGSTYPLRRLGRPAEARQRLDAAFSRLSQLKLYPAEQIAAGSEADLALHALADYEAGAGNFSRAVEIFQNLLDQVLAAKPKPETILADAFHLSNIYAATSPLHRRTARPDLAASLETRRLELWRHWDGRLPNNLFVQRQLKAANIAQARLR